MAFWFFTGRARYSQGKKGTPSAREM